MVSKNKRGPGNPNFIKGHIPYNKGEINLPHCKYCGKELSKYGVTMCRECRFTHEPPVPRGHKWSEEKKEAIRGRKLTTDHIRKVLRRREMSGLEKKVQEVIVSNRLPFRFVGNGKFFIGRKNPDFINTKEPNTAVEVYCRRQKENIRGVNIDEWKQERRDYFSSFGWSTIFIEDRQTNRERDVLSLLKGGY